MLQQITVMSASTDTDRVWANKFCCDSVCGACPKTCWPPGRTAATALSDWCVMTENGLRATPRDCMTWYNEPVFVCGFATVVKNRNLNANWFRKKYRTLHCPAMRRFVSRMVSLIAGLSYSFPDTWQSCWFMCGLFGLCYRSGYGSVQTEPEEIFFWFHPLNKHID